MIHDGYVKGAPLTQYTDTKTNVEAIAAPVAGMLAYASDTGAMGRYDGVAAAWVWGSAGDTHNDLAGLQGGVASEYYHLTSTQHTAMAAMVSAGLSALTSAEVDQLENIGAVTISNAQWGYLGAADQGIATGDSPTFADVFVPDGGTFGIAGNELLTVNAAGTFAFSGIAGVSVEDGDWIGNSAATARLGFDSSGATDYAYFESCYVGILDAGSMPGTYFHVAQNTNIEVWFEAATSAFAFHKPMLKFRRARNTLGAKAAVNNGDWLGAIGFWGWDGAAYIPSAEIFCLVDGVPGVNDMPGALYFATTADGAAATTVHATLSAAGYFGIGALTPGFPLEVAATNPQVFINASGNVSLVRYSAASGLWATGMIVDADRWSVFEDATSTKERLTVVAGGNVGINETAPNRRLHARETSASTNVIIPVARFESEVSGGVGAAGHGAGVEFYGETSTTTNQAMGLIAARWSVATHASRRSRLEFRAWNIGSEVLVGVVEAPNRATPDGNARGIAAVDWQVDRVAAAQVASGNAAVLSGGLENTVSGLAATVPGGWSCLASGDTSFAAGYDAHATHNRSFVLSATNAQTLSWGINTFTVRCHGGARFYSAAGVGTGVQLTAGGNAWAAISDRNVKENFKPVEGILGKIALLPIYDYNLKSQSADVRHIGPVSQDFNTLFGFSEAPLRINMLDIASVGLAGVQALHAEVVVLRERVRVLEALVD